MIIDCHGHVASTRILPQPFFAGWAENLHRKLGMADLPAERVESLLLEMLDDENCTELLAEMDEAGIDKVVLLIIDFSFAFPDWPFDLEAIHRFHRTLLNHSDRFLVFSGIDPRRGRAGVDFFETTIRDWGFHGLKIYPPCGYTPSDPRLYPFYEVCQRYRVPVLTHVGPTSERLSFGHSLPMAVDAAAQRFPGVDFILGHGGVMWHRDAALLAEYRSNVYLDLSGFQGELHNGHFRDCLQWHLARGLTHKLLFGLDWPIHRFFGSQRQWLDEFRRIGDECRVSPEQLERLLHGNFQELLDKRCTGAHERSC